MVVYESSEVSYSGKTYFYHHMNAKGENQVKKLVSILSAICILLAIMIVPAIAADPFTGTAAPDHITLSWTGDAQTSQTVTWRTDTTSTASIVQYVTGSVATFPSAGYVEKAGDAATLYKTDLGDENIHRVTLTGLTPGTAYTYRVGDGKNWSAAGTFTTESPNTTNFQVLVFGDAQPIYPSPQ